MEIKVKSFVGWMEAVDCEPSDSVENIRAKVQDKKGIPPDQQRLIFGGKRLEDGCSLSDYGIGNGAVVYLVLP